MEVEQRGDSPVLVMHGGGVKGGEVDFCSLDSCQRSGFPKLRESVVKWL